MTLKKSYTLTLLQSAFSAGGPMRFLSVMPSDSLFTSDVQWHLGFIGSPGFTLTNSASATRGIETVWADYQGDGVHVGIWDTGVQKTHWDLAANYDASKQVTINGTLNDGQPLTSTDGHGTSVAGLIAADDNGRGGVGIAFDAQVTGIRIFGGADDINQNWSRYLQTLDSLGQFDVTNHSYGGFPDFTVAGDVAKFRAAAVSGRGGLGTINVKSAGNSNVDGNGEAVDSSRFTVTVAALSNTPTANVASYSTYGAHVLVSAPAASVTTDLLGTGAGYDGLLSGDYTNQFGGTSAAGPVTAGVVALMLDANPGLGWRDVQNILAYSAVGVGSRYSKVTTNENFAWKWTGSGDWNGGGLHYSEDYGYGMVNAFNAVRMAEAWTFLHPVAATSANEQVVTVSRTVNQSILDLSTLTYTFNVDANISLEHVALTLSLTHSNFKDLRMRLVSPDGTVMSLYDGSTGSSTTSDGTFTYTFGADGFRGEASAGTWTLQIQDAARYASGTLKSLVFNGYGSTSSADSIYHYTNEVLQVLQSAGQSGRLTLSDMDGGTDWIDAAAMSSDLVLNLAAGTTSTVGGVAFLAIAAGTVIEDAIGGDGNDFIHCNTAGNVIYGMRGNDVLWGEEGQDIAGFRGLSSDYVISALDGVTWVVGPDGTDELMGFEWLRFDDGDYADPSAGMTPTDSRAPLLASISPVDGALQVPLNADLVMTFNEAVKAGGGYVSIYNGNGSLFERIDISSASFADKTVTLNPAGTLASGGSYYVLVDSGAILDLSNNAYAGIADPAAFNFSTVLALNVVNGTYRGESLIGTAGNDRINGLGGADVLYGKGGNDVLIGGAGRDSYVFDTALGAGNVDRIEGFVVADDTIRLENSIFTKLTKTGTLSSSFFRANVGGVALDANDYILFDTATGNVYYDADGNGAGTAVQFATLIDVVGVVTRADFVVI